MSASAPIFSRSGSEFAVLRPRYLERARAGGLTAPDLGKLLVQWQTALRLKDWRIDIAYAKDLATSDGYECYGLCRPCVDNKSAAILIRDPSTPCQGDKDPVGQIEETVVHELLHLHFAPFGTCTPAEIAAEEQAVWAISEALIAQKGRDAYRVVRAMVANDNALVKYRSAPARRRVNTMNEEQKKKALDLIQAGDGEGALELIKEIMTGATGEGPAGAPTSEDDPARMAEATPEKDPKDPKDDQKTARAPARASARVVDLEVERARSEQIEAGKVSTHEGIRLMLHNARELDKLALPPAVETKIRKCQSIGEARSHLDTARAMMPAPAVDGAPGAGPRPRSGATPPAGRGPDRSKEGPVERKIREGVERQIKARKGQG